MEAVLSAGRLERMLIVVLHAVAGASLSAWLTLHAELRLAAPVLAGIVAVSALMAGLGVLLARRALPLAPGRLRWDGQAWSCAAASSLPLQRLVVAMDLGLWLLLRLHPAGGNRPVWRAVSARSAGNAWHGLRVALSAHAGAAAPGGDGSLP